MASSIDPKHLKVTELQAANLLPPSLCLSLLPVTPAPRRAAIFLTVSEVPGKQQAHLGQTPRGVFSRTSTDQASFPPTASHRCRTAARGAKPPPRAQHRDQGWAPGAVGKTPLPAAARLLLPRRPGGSRRPPRHCTGAAPHRAPHRGGWRLPPRRGCR